MDDDETNIECPGCGAVYHVVWVHSLITGDGPTYCPFCCEEVDNERDEE